MFVFVIRSLRIHLFHEILNSLEPKKSIRDALQPENEENVFVINGWNDSSRIKCVTSQWNLGVGKKGFYASLNSKNEILMLKMQRKMLTLCFRFLFMRPICIYASDLHLCIRYACVYPMTSQMMMQGKWENIQGHQMSFSGLEAIVNENMINKQ